MKFILFLFLTILVLPIASIIFYLFSPATEVWQHLRSTVLNTYFTNTVLLTSSVLLGTSIIGIPLAWLTSMYQFPCKKIFEWALLFPFAFPSYILAYVYYSHKEKFINLNSFLAATVIMSLAFYPYVYLFSRQAFHEISPSLIYASKTLKNSNLKTFWKVIFPLSRPAIFSGILLVCMEVMGDFGTVDFFSIDTLATGIYRTWFGLGSLNGAIQISFILLLFIISIVILDHHFRKKKRFYQKQIPHSQKLEKKLTGIQSFFTIMICLIPIVLGFVLPFSILVINIFQLGYKSLDKDFFEISSRSFLLASSASLICIFIGFVIALIKKFQNGRLLIKLSQSISLGYAIPGSILAITVLTSLKIMDDIFSFLYFTIFGHEYPNLILSGTIFALFYAYSIRFTSVAFQSANASLTKISPSIEWASRLAGYSIFKTSLKIHFPILKSSLFVAFILIFVDLIKELPATMVLRPFNFETIAIRTYNLASDERLIEASPAALLIVILGTIPVIILSKYNKTFNKEPDDEIK